VQPPGRQDYSYQLYSGHSAPCALRASVAVRDPVLSRCALESNLRMRGSKPRALSPGDIPVNPAFANCGTRFAYSPHYSIAICRGDRFTPRATKPDHDAGILAATASASAAVAKAAKTQAPVPVILEGENAFNQSRAAATSG